MWLSLILPVLITVIVALLLAKFPPDCLSDNVGGVNVINPWWQAGLSGLAGAITILFLGPMMMDFMDGGYSHKRRSSKGY